MKHTYINHLLGRLLLAATLLAVSWTSVKAAETTLWEGSESIVNYDNSFYVLSDGGAELSAVGAKAGDIIRFYANPDYNATLGDWEFEVREGHWADNAPYGSATSSDSQSFDTDGNSVVLKITLTETILSRALTQQNWGGVFVVQGRNIKLTKVTISGAEPYAALNDNNTVLTFFYDDKKAANNGMDVGPFQNADYRGWNSYAGNITKVVFDSSMDSYTDLTSTAFWFWEFTNLEEVVDIEYLHTDNVTSMECMFGIWGGTGSTPYTGKLPAVDMTHFNTSKVVNMNGVFTNCAALTTLDLSSFDTSSVTDMSTIFSGCTGLRTISVGSGWTTAKVTNSSMMFQDCTSLVGGAGTTYDASHTDVAYAHIDGGESNPGYLTDKNVPASTFNGEVYMVEQNSTIMPNQAITSQNVSMTPGNDTEWTTDGNMGPSTKPQLVLDVSQYYGATGTYSFGYSMKGTNTPKDGELTTNESTGEVKNLGTYYRPRIKNLPHSGSYVVFETSQDGSLIIPIRVPATRAIYVTDGSGNAMTDIQIRDDSGNAIALLSEPLCAISTTEEFNGFVSFNAKQGEKYYVFVNSTAATRYGGYAFSPEAVTINPATMANVLDLVEDPVITDMEIFHANAALTVEPGRAMTPTQNVSMTPGNDTEWTKRFLVDGETQLNFTASQYYPSSSTTYAFDYSIQGTNGPKDGGLAEDGTNTGSSYDYTKQNLPQSGGFVIYEASKDGSLIIPFSLNANKPIYVVDANGKVMTDIQIKDASGQPMALLADPLCVISTTDASTGFLSFNVKQGEQYYVFGSGTKARFSGYIFNDQTIDIDPATMANVKDVLEGTTAAVAEPYAILSDDQTTLTFFYDDQKSAKNGMGIGPFSNPGDRRWESVAASVTTVKFDESMANCTSLTSTAYWFYGFQTLTTITGIGNLKTDNVTDMQYMFYDCNLLTNIELTGFNTTNVTNMRGMFYKCQQLQSIDLSSFNTAKVTDVSWMFYNCNAMTTIYVGSLWALPEGVTDEDGAMFMNCTSLKGGANTTYDETHADASYAHIDGGESNPGYFTDIADAASVAEVVFNRNANELALQCSTPNTTIWYALTAVPGSSTGSGSLEKPFTPAEANSYCLSLGVGVTSTDDFYVKGKIVKYVNNGEFGTQYGNASFYISADGQESSEQFYIFRTLYLGNVKYSDESWTKPAIGDEVIVCGKLTVYKSASGDLLPETEANKSYIYSLNGNIVNDAQWQQYTAPLALSEDCIVKAYAELPTGARSKVSSYTFTVIDLPKVATPTFTWSGEQLAMTTETEGADIYFSVKEYDAEAAGDGSESNPYNVAGALKYISTLGADVQSEQEVYVKGVVSSIQSPFETTYGNAIFNISDNGDNKNYLTAYRALYLQNQRYTSGQRQIQVGDDVVLFGKVVNYKGTTPETVSGAAYLYSMEEPDLQNRYENPITVSGNVVIRAKATKQGLEDSELAMTYTGIEPYAVLSENNTVLNFFYDDKKRANNGMDLGPFKLNYNVYADGYTVSVSGREWEDKVSTITTVVFDPSFANCTTLNSTAGWFCNDSNLVAIRGIEYLNTESITDMSGMFWACKSLTTIDVSSFKTSNVTNMWAMFDDCTSLTTLKYSDQFITSKVTNMQGMFYACSSLTSLDLSSFDVSNVTYFNSMFRGCSKLENLNLTGWNTSSAHSMQYMFRDCSSLKSLDLSGFNTQNVTTMSGMFYDCSGLTSLDVSRFDTQNVTDMQGMFDNCSSLTSLNVSNFNTQNVKFMAGMFYGCSSLTNLDLSHFNTSNVTAMNHMFRGCSKLESLNLSGWNTSKVTTMMAMFSRCESLTNLDVSGFETEAVTDINQMFYNCFKLKSLNLSNFRTPNLKEIHGLFYRCEALESLDISNLNTSQVTDFHSIFYGCASLKSLDISHFDTSQATEMALLFARCSSLASIQAGNAAIPDSIYAQIGNPNLLLYVNEASQAPQSVTNVVVNGAAENIVLTDVEQGNNNFYCPQEFTAHRISYTHNYRQATQVGVSRGWETIVLPFTVQTITHEKNGPLAPFGVDGGKPFWLRQLTENGLVSAQQIEANMPYLISMPNNGRYPADYNQAGNVTFSATNVVVPMTEQREMSGNNRMLIPTTMRVAQSPSVYAINRNASYENNPEGSIFVADYREVRPFEAYVEHTNGARFFTLSDLSEGDVTDIQAIHDIASADVVKVYNLSGVLLKTGKRQEVMSQLPKGIYIVNGVKVVVK